VPDPDPSNNSQPEDLEVDENRIGLRPKPGWQRRNVEFIQNVLLPSYFARRTSSEARPLSEAVAGSGLGLTWIGHATFLLETSVGNVLFDPNWALWHGPVRRLRRPGMEIENLPAIDLIVVSHAHFDHLHLASLRKLGSPSKRANATTVVVPNGVGSLVRNCGFRRVIELSWGESIVVKTGSGEIRVEMTPARHWGARLIHDLHREFGGFLVEVENRTVFHAGDSAYFDGFRRIGETADIDVAILPIGAYEAVSGRAVHMNPEEAVQAFLDLKAEMLIPMHYGTFPLGGEPMEEPEARFRVACAELGLEERMAVLEEGAARFL